MENHPPHNCIEKKQVTSAVPSKKKYFHYGSMIENFYLFFSVKLNLLGVYYKF